MILLNAAEQISSQDQQHSFSYRTFVSLIKPKCLLLMSALYWDDEISRLRGPSESLVSRNRMMPHMSTISEPQACVRGVSLSVLFLSIRFNIINK